MTSVIIPYRDRAEHLEILAPRLAQVLPDAEILVIEQADGKPFNRAKLLNVGAQFARGYNLIMHDVDKVPLIVKYWPPMYYYVAQLCKSEIQKVGYLGGVTAFYTEVFKEKINGYSNNFWGWGGEDNEMAFRLQALKIPVFEQFGEWHELLHAPNSVQFDPIKWRQAQQPRSPEDGLSECTYEIKELTRHDFYTKITVEI